MSSASRRAYCKSSALTSRSYSTTSAAARSCRPRIVIRVDAARARADEIRLAAPRDVVAAPARERICSSARSASASRPANACSATTPVTTRSQKWRRSVGIDDVLAHARRHRPASSAKAPSRAGSSVSMTPLIQRASTGDKPLLPMAIVTGERSTIAGMMKVHSAWSSTTLQKRFAADGRGRDGRVDGLVVRRRDDEPVGLERVGGIRVRKVGDGARRAASSANRSESSRRQDRHGGLGLEQQRHAALGHDSAADDEDGPIREIREQG